MQSAIAHSIVDVPSVLSCGLCQGHRTFITNGDGADGFITFVTDNLLNYGFTDGLVTVQPVP